MNTKIIIGILALVVVASLAFYLMSNPTTPPSTTTTTQPSSSTTSPTTTTLSSPAESQAVNAVDQELGSAVQGISNSDIQSAMTS